MTLGARLRHWLALVLPRWLAFLLGIRRPTPWDGYWPRRPVQVVPVADTGGFRAAWRPQDPSQDPREPGGGESSSAGTDHGWSNCTMASAALALAYQQPRGSKAPWGGDMRHHQSDLSGGTDLYDARAAWSAYGETLTIRSGAGWSALVTAHNEGRAIVIQGQGNVPGAETFDGGHACAIAPESQGDGDWLFGDPLASGWQWVTQSAIRSWAERWQSSIAFAVGEKPPPPPTTPPPEPVPVPPPAPPPAPGYPEGYASGYRDGRAAEADATFASWSPGGPVVLPDVTAWDAGAWASLGDTLDDADTWASLPVPMLAVWAAQTPAAWGVSGWTAAVWRG
jgi:hypothetical protein